MGLRVPPLPPDSSLIRSVLTAVLGASAVCLLIVNGYAEAPLNGWHFDDWDNIVDRHAIRMEQLSWSSVTAALSDGLLPRRALANLSFALDWWRSGGDPAAFIRVNILLHLLATLCAAILLLRTVKPLGRPGHGAVALAAALIALWAVHPIQVQSVTYVVQRMNLMASLLVIVSVFSFIRWRLAVARRWPWAALTLLAWGAGCLSKENAWIAPLLWWLAEYTVVRNRRPLIDGPLDRLLLPLPFILAVLLTVDLALGISPLQQWLSSLYGGRDFGLWERLMTQPRVIWFHLGQILSPGAGVFSIEHDFAPSTGWTSPPSTLAAMLALAALTGAGLLAMATPGWRNVGFWILWLPITLATESSVIPLEMVFEHRMYLPSLAIPGVLLCLALRCHPRPLPLATMTLVAAMLTLPLQAITRERVSDWRSDLALYESATRTAPGSARAWSGLGAAQLRAGLPSDARESLSRAVRLDSELYQAWERLGVIAFDEGSLDNAARYLTRALSGGNRHSTWNHLGEVLFAREDLIGAINAFNLAVAGAPWLPAYRWNLALALESVGRCEKAREHWLYFLEVTDEPAEAAEVRAHLESPAGFGACRSD